MAIAFKVIGEVRKVVDNKGRVRGFGVLLELYFPDGQTRQYRYTGRRKKDVMADMHNGRMARWVNCARLDDRGHLVFEIQLC